MGIDHRFVGESVVAYNKPFQSDGHQCGSVAIFPRSSKLTLKDTTLNVGSFLHEIMNEVDTGRYGQMFHASSELYDKVTNKLDEMTFRMAYLLGEPSMEGHDRVYSIPVSVIATNGYPLNGHSRVYLAVFRDGKPQLAIAGGGGEVIDTQTELNTINERLAHAFSDALGGINIHLEVTESNGNIYKINTVKPARGIGLR